MRHIVLLTVVLLMSLGSASAFAASPIPITIGVGMKGGLNGSTVTAVPEDEPIDGTGPLDPNIYPTFGFGGTVGLDVEAYVMDMVGLETGFYLSYDNGNGFEDIKNVAGATLVTVNQKQRTTAYHIPLIAKFSIPGAIVRPTFGLGVEFVLQQDTTLEFDPDIQPNNKRVPLNENYTLFVFSFALEFNLGVVRVPLELRGGYNVGFDNTASGRTDYNSANGEISYNSAYIAHMGLFTGIIYDFDFIL